MPQLPNGHSSFPVKAFPGPVPVFPEKQVVFPRTNEVQRLLRKLKSTHEGRNKIDSKN